MRYVCRLCISFSVNLYTPYSSFISECNRGGNALAGGLACTPVHMRIGRPLLFICLTEVAILRAILRPLYCGAIYNWQCDPCSHFLATLQFRLILAVDTIALQLVF